MLEKEVDVLVIGTGGAGLRAAVAAHERGAETLVVSKTLAGKAGCTVMAEGGYNAAIRTFDIKDSPQSHFEDTMKSGAGLSNPELVRTLANDAPERIQDLEGYGALFSRGRGGLIGQRKMGAQSHQRTCYAGDRTGHEIVMTLLQRVRSEGIQVWNYLFALDLIVSGGKVRGLLAFDIKRPGYVLIKSKATILATGGAGRCWAVTTNSFHSTGDGYMLAARAGATMCDLEQIQFHPTGMVYPDAARGILVTEAVRGDGGLLFGVTPEISDALEENRRRRERGEPQLRIDPEAFGAERFMTRYDPERMELSSRDVVTRAITREVLEGRRTRSGGVLLSVVHLDRDYVRTRLSTTYKQFKDLSGIDITQQPMEVAPTAHHIMGGVVIDKDCSTSLESLYACGEVVGGIHGGNRIGGNAIAEGQVFGAIAGKSAAAAAKTVKDEGVDLLSLARELASKHDLDLEKGGGDTRPCAIKRDLQQIMTAKAGVFREEASLQESLAELDALRERLTRSGVTDSSLPYSQDVVDRFEASNMVEFSRLVVQSAVLRRDSRGAHYRNDFPDRNDQEFGENIFVEGGTVWKAKRWS
ncbi:MAG: FAD-binding protein [Chloroflexota bacterium]|nr:MAG: FAD-binding protein [Chloroflexota bacterium]